MVDPGREELDRSGRIAGLRFPRMEILLSERRWGSSQSLG
jgi:hypothetical protein